MVTAQVSPVSRRAVPRVKLSLRLDPDLDQRVRYWADRDNAESVNEWIAEAIEQRIARANGDYDLPTAEVARLNQLVDANHGIETELANLTRVVLAMSDSLVTGARGDSYLMDKDDGELPHA